jgi:hypothetical protein
MSEAESYGIMLWMKHEGVWHFIAQVSHMIIA